MNYAQIRQYDLANGNGIGCTLFVSGCTFHCPNCFNKEYQDFKHGNEFTAVIENEFIEMCKNKNVDHVAILGGDLMCQRFEDARRLLHRLQTEVNKPIWLWTGFTLEELRPKKIALLEAYVDYLIDGQFVEELKDLKLCYRGSSNQNVYKKESGVFKKIL